MEVIYCMLLMGSGDRWAGEVDDGEWWEHRVYCRSGCEMTGELAHDRRSTQNVTLQIVWHCDITSSIQLSFFASFLLPSFPSSVLIPLILYLTSPLPLSISPIRWWGRDPEVHPVFPWQPVRSDDPTRPHWNPEGYLLFAGLQRRPWY